MVIASHKCAGCETFQADSWLETVTVGDDTFYACETCCDELSGPGKHEGVSYSERALAIVLEALRGISMEDHFLTDEWDGYLGVFGEHILHEDHNGFVEVRSFSSHDDAMREVNRWEDDGFGAQEDDAFINYGRSGVEVSFGGKHVGTFETLSRARACVSIEMRKQGYFPNVWLTGEHGPTIRRIDVW